MINEDALSIVKKRAISLILTSFISAFIYWKLIVYNLVGDEIKNGVGFPVAIAPFLLFFFYSYLVKNIHRAFLLAYPMAVTLGIFLGGISGFFERNTDGLIIQVVMLTFATSLSMIWLYKNKIIVVDNHFFRFMMVLTSVLSITGSIDFVMSFVDLTWHSLYVGSSNTAIALNVVYLILGYMVFILDLNIIEIKLNQEQGSQSEYWFFAIELLIDVAWTYLAILFLLLRLKGRKNN